MRRISTAVFAITTAMALVVACRRGPPERLVPRGAKVIRERGRWEWPRGKGEPQGLDKVDATFGRGQLTVDWADYTCSGWN